MGRRNCLSLLLTLPTPAPDIRLDWETYALEEREDQLLELLVFYGPPFPLRDKDGNEVLCPETQESSRSSQSPSVSKESSSSPEVAHSVSTAGWGGGGGRDAIGLSLCEPQQHLDDRPRAAPATATGPSTSSRLSCRSTRGCPRTTCTASAPSRW